MGAFPGKKLANDLGQPGYVSHCGSVTAWSALSKPACGKREVKANMQRPKLIWHSRSLQGPVLCPLGAGLPGTPLAG